MYAVSFLRYGANYFNDKVLRASMDPNAGTNGADPCLLVDTPQTEVRASLRVGRPQRLPSSHHPAAGCCCLLYACAPALRPRSAHVCKLCRAVCLFAAPFATTAASSAGLAQSDRLTCVCTPFLPTKLTHAPWNFAATLPLCYCTSFPLY